MRGKEIDLLGGMIQINNDRRAGCPWYGKLILSPEARTSSRFIWFYPTNEFFILPSQGLLTTEFRVPFIIDTVFLNFALNLLHSTHPEIAQ